ncbi:MAG TPA: rhodanese-like domain-containing protein [Polyangia bacterium]|jgi:monothiol glutaredoxin|nr:rhodanese-like domain-containing protein [Polyangia bacterium]
MLASHMTVRQITAQELKAMLDQHLPLQLFDVRTEAERAIATIGGARHLDQAAAAELAEPDTDRGALIVFHCHHGIRSQSAAMHFAALGFTNLCNLVGGIEAWSLAVDPSVRRY